MKTIVIGGAGFIGSLVSQALIQSGRDMTIVGRPPRPSHVIAGLCLPLCRSWQPCPDAGDSRTRL